MKWPHAAGPLHSTRKSPTVAGTTLKHFPIVQLSHGYRPPVPSPLCDSYARARKSLSFRYEPSAILEQWEAPRTRTVAVLDVVVLAGVAAVFAAAVAYALLCERL